MTWPSTMPQGPLRPRDRRTEPPHLEFGRSRKPPGRTRHDGFRFFPVTDMLVPVNLGTRGGRTMRRGTEATEGATRSSLEGDICVPAGRKTVTGSRVGRRRFLQMGAGAAVGAAVARPTRE